MKYKDLPNERLISKLLLVSFDTPSKNRDIYMWCDEILPHIRFLENERVKLVSKYGEKTNDFEIDVPKNKYNEFFSEFIRVLDMEIDENISNCPAEWEWFDDSKCQYPNDKKLWLSPHDIGILVKIKEQE